ncbi:unnamed protein product, partial [Symbiodinium sp. CCMP2592]
MSSISVAADALRILMVTILRQVLKSTLDLTTISALTNIMPPAARLLRALDDKRCHHIFTVVVPSGGGKSTQCALLSDERLLITGFVGVDKDAMLTAHETGCSGTSDYVMISAATSMLATDVVGAEGDDAEEASNVRVDMEQVKRVILTELCEIKELSSSKMACLKSLQKTLIGSFLKEVASQRPLHQAAEAGRADLVARLLDSKADADATTAARDIQLSLTRAPGDETWGFEFDAFQESQRRQVLKEILPNTPAGRWNQKQQEMQVDYLRPGDELLEVNGSREATAKSDLRRWHQVNLLFRLRAGPTALVLACAQGHQAVAEGLLAA